MAVTADGACDVWRVRIELEVVALVELDEEALGRAGQVSADRRLGRHRGVGNRHHVPVRSDESANGRSVFEVVHYARRTSR